MGTLKESKKAQLSIGSAGVIGILTQWSGLDPKIAAILVTAICIANIFAWAYQDKGK